MSGGSVMDSDQSAFKPDLKPGTMPGQQDLRVQAWSVDDVVKWLLTLSLGQYRDTFRDGAVDGAFLYALNDDDLRNTLGVEHRLHRKKIIFSIEELKKAEAIHDEQMKMSNLAEQAMAYNSGLVQDYRGNVIGGGATGAPGGAMVPFGVVGGAGGTGESDDPFAGMDEGITLHLPELMSWVRHQKYKKLKEALNQIQNKPFDSSVVKVQYIEGIGTAYIDQYEKEPFNMNKTDEHGNTLLSICAQNGNTRIAKMLVHKGANPNHQNKLGQTAGHFSISYDFFDFSSWLYDPENGAGADDLLENIYGLSAYDGLVGEEEQIEQVKQDKAGDGGGADRAGEAGQGWGWRRSR